MFQQIKKKIRSITGLTNAQQQISSITPEWGVVHSGPAEGVNIYISSKWKEMLTGEYDRFLFEAITRSGFDLTGSIIWDVGAHIGYHTLAFSRLSGPKGKVFAFEPNPYNLERLRANIKRNPQIAENIKTFEIALSDADGKHEFKINSNVDNSKSSGSYLDYGSTPSDRYSAEVFNDFQIKLVQVNRADTLIATGILPAPNFIKLDIEGAEVRFLKGAIHILESSKPHIAIEVHNIQNMFHISELLHQYEYKPILLDDKFQSSSRCYILAIPR